jgi:HAD superfamily hydrolase (TIGR01509 family)
MIKCIVFDLNHTIISHNSVLLRKKCLQLFGSKYYPFVESLENDFYTPFVLGKITENKMLLELFCKNNIPLNKMNKYKHLYRSSKFPIPGIINLIKKIKIKNKILFSEDGKEWFDFKVKKFKLDKIFKKTICTSDFGLKKDNSFYFKNIPSSLGIKSSDILLIDDSAIFIKKAKREGWKGIRFLGLSHLRKKLNKLSLI